MQERNKIDYLIIGQGLAGSALALELLKRKKRVIVFDEPEKNRATAIAAGLFNPVTGKMMTRTWHASELFGLLPHFYSQAELLAGKKFFYPTPLYRPFLSVEEQNEWMGKSTAPGMLDYIERVYAHSAFGQDINDPFGGLLLKNCGYVNTNAFIDGVRDLLRTTNSFRAQHFVEEQMVFIDQAVAYDGIEADKVIFANGLGTLSSAFFSKLPMRVLKGETLLIRTDLPANRIYNRGVYIVPVGEKGVYKVGATYNAKDRTLGTTAEGKQELKEKLDALLKIPYEIIGDDWGFRPTTPDQKPILGAHPHHPNLVMFNGLGTKGVSLAPYFALQLINWLEGNGEIEPDVDIGRFY